jgi:hypothetical protein
LQEKVMANESTRPKTGPNPRSDERPEEKPEPSTVVAYAAGDPQWEEEEGLKSLGAAAAFGTVVIDITPSPLIANEEGAAAGVLTSKGRLGGPNWPRDKDGWCLAVPAAGATNAPDLKRLEGTPQMAGRSKLARAVDDLTRVEDPRSGSGPHGPEHGVGPAQAEQR